MSPWQLHGVQNREPGGGKRGRTAQVEPARSCGMEAASEPQLRTQVKLRKAARSGVSAPPSVTPDIQSWPSSIGDGGGGTLCRLTQGELPGSAARGNPAPVGGKETPTTHRCPGNEREKSDHPIVVMKPGNAGGAKGVTE